MQICQSFLMAEPDCNTLKDDVYRDQYVAAVVHNFSGESCTSVRIGD